MNKLSHNLRRAIPRDRQIPRGHAQFMRNYQYSIIQMLGNNINAVFTSQNIQ